MHLHEHQAKRLFADYGIPVPAGRVLDSAALAAEVAGEIGGDAWVVKAQVHAGGRGKGGGVRRVGSVEELEQAAGLGKRRRRKAPSPSQARTTRRKASAK